MSREFSRESIRIAAFDLDGTVLNGSLMSEAVGKALEKLSRAGVAVTVSTGRDISQIPRNVLSCFTYRVTTNGSSVTDCDGNVLKDHPIDAGTAIKAIDIIRKCHGTCCIYLNGFVVGTPLFLLRLLKRTDYLAKSHRTATRDVRNNRIVLSLKRFLRRNACGVYKIQTFFSNQADALKAADLLRKSCLLNPIVIARSSLMA